MSKIFVWANSDMDGAVSTILLGNMFPNMDFRYSFFGNFLESYKAWEGENLEHYDKVFVVGMVLDQTMVNKIDDDKIVFISDRGEKLKTFDSTLISEEYTSCSKLIYKTFKKKFEIPDKLKLLTLYADDYNDYKLKYQESEYLNAVYRKTTYNRFKWFVKRFWNGYDGLTDKEIKKAREFFDEIEEEVSGLTLYKGQYKDWNVIATFSKASVNEIAKELMNIHKSDVVIVINPDTEFVSFRKPVGSEADIAFMAEKLCDGGGGEYASGGSLTKQFLSFSEELKEL